MTLTFDLELFQDGRTGPQSDVHSFLSTIADCTSQVSFLPMSSLSFSWSHFSNLFLVDRIISYPLAYLT